MKYCQHTLLRMVLCLLLVCSANVASAQTFAPTLVDPQVNGLTVRFALNFGRSVTGNQRLLPRIRITGINSDEITSFMPLSSFQCSGFNNIVQNIPNPPEYIICMGGGTRGTLELKVKNPDAAKNIAIQLRSVNAENISESVLDNFNTLNVTVNPTIFIRIKAFLEGALQ